MDHIRILLRSLLFSLFPFALIFSQTEITVQAVRLTEPIVVDGILSESIWQTALPVSGFLQRDPNEGSPSTQQTFVRIAYDDDAIYVGADMRDTAPDSIVARLSRRDEIAKEDFFAVGIDSYHDHRSGYFFGLSAGGTIMDGILYNDDWTDDTWDGVWEGRVSRSDQGWTAEMRIPFSQLRFQKQDHYIWGIDFRRDIARKNEETYLVYTPKASSGFVSRFPHLVGIENIKPARHIEVLPYARAKAEYTHPDEADPFHDGSSYSPDAGVDFKVGLSNNLTLDMTMNPDFGQVEVDPAVVNLSDVETYFDEKRPFFIEGASTFNFGYGGANSYWGFNWSSPTFFYSRRIGRSPQGELPDNDYSDMPEGVHILGAAKVSGKLPGNWNVGTIHALTRREFGRYALNGREFKSEVEPMTYYGIFRAQKEINDARQGIGVLSTVTARHFDDQSLKQDINDNALTFGLDGWTFLDTSKTWVFTGWAGASRVGGTRERILDLQTNSQHYFQRPDAKEIRLDSSATELSGFAGRFYLNKQKGRIIVNSAIGVISPGFDVNDLGFLNRADVINGHFGMGYLWTKPGKVFREADVIGAIFQSTDFDWNSTWKGIFLMWECKLLNYMYFYTDIAYNPETVNKFRTRGGPLSINHEGFQTEISFTSDDRKPFVFNAYYYKYFCTPKDQYQYVQANLEWKPGSNVSISAGPGFGQGREFAQWVDAFDDPTAVRTYGKRYVFGEMKQNEISANIRLNWTFTPRLSLQLYLQPLISHGDYEHFKELDRPKSYAFDIYSGEQVIRSNGEYEIDPDASGPAESFSFDNPDFNYKSLRGNAVLRWEYRPGSTLYLVWTQNRWNDVYEEPFSFRRSAKQLWNTKADNIFMIKATYWWSL
jgi:hypothetical protein